MTDPRLPSGLVSRGRTREFTDEDRPEALVSEHSIRPGRWGVLHVLAGGLSFVDLASDKEIHLAAPATHVIAPEAPHRLHLDGPVRFRIDFFEPGG